jgi:hypothetical protein
MPAWIPQLLAGGQPEFDASKCRCQNRIASLLLNILARSCSNQFGMMRGWREAMRTGERLLHPIFATAGGAQQSSSA